MHHARLLAAALALAALSACKRSTPTTADGCDPSIKVPDGFCATLDRLIDARDSTRKLDAKVPGALR